MGPSSLICKIKAVGVTGDALSSKTPIGWGSHSRREPQWWRGWCVYELLYFLFYISGVRSKFLFEEKVSKWKLEGDYFRYSLKLGDRTYFIIHTRTFWDWKGDALTNHTEATDLSGGHPRQRGTHGHPTLSPRPAQRALALSPIILWLDCPCLSLHPSSGCSPRDRSNQGQPLGMKSLGDSLRDSSRDSNHQETAPRLLAGASSWKKGTRLSASDGWQGFSLVPVQNHVRITSFMVKVSGNQPAITR